MFCNLYIINLVTSKFQKKMRLINRRKVESGKIYNAYFDACENDELYTSVYTKKAPFGGGWSEDVEVQCFDFNEKTYAVLGYDHFNGHMSGFSDPAAIFGLYIAELV